ncbi:hypothetical protein IT570_12425 [Candidatus Sumerlaeota bacterium]|nr:hypothetical protein [Candidatus Sumerlaeota bacterium]
MRSAAAERWQIVAVAILIYATLVACLPVTQIDDSFITYRYAENLAMGRGFVFNAGERVEGITNLLWALMLAAARITGASIPTASLVMSLFLQGATFWRLNRLFFLMGIGVRQSFALLVVAALGAHWHLASSNGLEGALYGLLLAEILLRVASGKMGAAYLACGLLFMTRPEGAMVGIALAFLDVLRNGKKTATRSLVFFAIVGMVSLFRCLYFGALVPNSIIAKSSGLKHFGDKIMRGSGYVFLFLAGSGFFVLPSLALVANIRKVGVASLPTEAILSMIVAAGSIAVAVQNGGDWMPNSRLLTQYVPVWLTLAAVAVRREVIPKGVVILLWGWAAVVIGTIGFRAPWKFNSRISGDTQDFYQSVVEKLRGGLKASDLCSAEALGYPAFEFMDVPFHDPMGLTDAWLARNGKPVPRFGKVGVSHTLLLKPDVLLWHTPAWLRTVEPDELAGYRVFRHGKGVVMIRSDRGDLCERFMGWPEPPISWLSRREKKSSPRVN